MPRFVPDSRPISAQHPIAEFYREEFLKHHRCLQQQRAYYSESVITNVEAALSKIIGRLDRPLLEPDANEREGYVPNVVYSCGAVVHQGELIIPYAMSDFASTFATIPLADVLGAMVKP